MRLYIKLSENDKIIPYDYQRMLTGVVQKWIGQQNEEHGKQSLYSFSWLQNTVASRSGINLTNNSYFFISAYEDQLIKRIAKGILDSPETFCGSRVTDVQIQYTPDFSHEERFVLNSPVLLRKREGEDVRHVTFLDNDFDALLTENLRSKLKFAGLNTSGVEVCLDTAYSFPRTKLVNYNGIKNKATLAPIMIKGTPEQIAFAWAVGLGNSTGIGFGALK